MMQLRNIRLSGNEHHQLKADVIYAELVDGSGHIEIMATLEYILAAIRDRNYRVEGVTVEWKEQRGARCSYVMLDRYSEAQQAQGE